MFGFASKKMSSNFLLLISVLCVSTSLVHGGIEGGVSPITDEKTLDELTSQLTVLVDELSVNNEQNATLKFVKIHTATRQVVAGSLTKATATIRENDVEKTCQLSVWEKPWMKFTKTDVECGEEESKRKYTLTKGSEERKRKRRDVLVGGLNEVPPEELESLNGKLAESFVQLGQTNGTSLGVNRLFGASKQVVAGVMYKIRCEIETEDGPKNCTVKLWEKPWMNFRQVDVDCGEKQYQVVNDGRPKRESIRPLMEQESFDVNETPEVHQFETFKLQFNRNYDNAEEHDMRFRIFKQNLYQIRQLNKFEQGTAEYGVTEFADMTLNEYKMRTGLLMRRPEDTNDIGNSLAEIPDIELPESFDWREKGAVTPVKNQGSCGSCWAFSVTGNVEGIHAVKTGKLESYSEQELVDCDQTDSGCNGGLPDNAYKAIETIGGLELEDEYPYVAKRTKCHFNGTMSHVRVKGAIDFKAKDEDGIAKWLTVNGPVSIGINANAMQFYRGGISHPWKVLCGSAQLDHGVLLVGYGVARYPKFNKVLPYWIVKNSWGPRWGEQGYYRVYRGDNTCGVSSMASSAVLA